MPFSVALPSLSSALRDLLYPMKIKQGGTFNILPCDIIELHEVESWEIPSLPIDSGSNISDTIYTMPKTITCRVYVNTLEYERFNQQLHRWQFTSGFDIQGLDYQTYKGYRLLDKSEPQTADTSGAYIINLTFQEVRLVKAFSVGIAKQSTAKAGFSSKANAGSKAPKSVPKSALKTIKDKGIGGLLGG